MEYTENNLNAIYEAWQNLKLTDPKLRIRDAASKLGLSEAQLLCTKMGQGVTRLEGSFQEILKRVPDLGKVMALTRNDYAVIEKSGVFKQPQFMGPVMGQVVDEVIDLRLFMNHWKMAFAVSDTVRGKTMFSLQFFSGSGLALHKIYLEDESNLAVYQSIVDDYKSPNQSPYQPVEQAALPQPDLPDTEIDAEAFLKAWAALKDTHDFFMLLKQHRVGRMQALRLAEGKFTQKVAPACFKHALELAKESQTPIMVFVGNIGIIEIHTGTVNNLVQVDNWFNVMDPDFNLHVQEDAIKHAFLVQKPTSDGIIHSLELFDKDNNNILLMFGKRKPGSPELENWKTIIHRLSQQPVIA